MSPESWRSPFSPELTALICAAPKSAARAASEPPASRFWIEARTQGSAGVDAGEHRLGEHVRCGRPFDVAAVRLLRHRERRQVERQKVKAIVVLAMSLGRAGTAVAGATEITHGLTKSAYPDARRDAFCRDDRRSREYRRWPSDTMSSSARPDRCRRARSSACGAARPTRTAAARCRRPRRCGDREFAVLGRMPNSSA